MFLAETEDPFPVLCPPRLISCISAGFFCTIAHPITSTWMITTGNGKTIDVDRVDVLKDGLELIRKFYVGKDTLK